MDYITLATRVHFITFSFYNPNSDYFVTVDIMIEFLASGVVNPTYMNIIPSRANIYESDSEKGLQACDIFRVMLSFYIVYICYLKLVISKYSKHIIEIPEKDRSTEIGIFRNITGFLYITVFLLCMGTLLLFWGLRCCCFVEDL